MPFPQHNLPAMSPVSSWTTEDVAQWVKQCLLLPYSEAFRRCGINGQRLVDISEAQLREEVGMQDTSHLIRLLSHIAVFRAQLGREPLGTLVTPEELKEVVVFPPPKVASAPTRPTVAKADSLVGAASDSSGDSSAVLEGSSSAARQQSYRATSPAVVPPLPLPLERRAKSAPAIAGCRPHAFGNKDGSLCDASSASSAVMSSSSRTTMTGLPLSRRSSLHSTATTSAASATGNSNAVPSTLAEAASEALRRALSGPIDQRRGFGQRARVPAGSLRAGAAQRPVGRPDAQRLPSQDRNSRSTSARSGVRCTSSLGNSHQPLQQRAPRRPSPRASEPQRSTPFEPITRAIASSAPPTARFGNVVVESPVANRSLACSRVDAGQLGTPGKSWEDATDGTSPKSDFKETQAMVAAELLRAAEEQLRNEMNENTRLAEFVKLLRGDVDAQQALQSAASRLVESPSPLRCARSQPAGLQIPGSASQSPCSSRQHTPRLRRSPQHAGSRESTPRMQWKPLPADALTSTAGMRWKRRTESLTQLMGPPSASSLEALSKASYPQLPESFPSPVSSEKRLLVPSLIPFQMGAALEPSASSAAAPSSYAPSSHGSDGALSPRLRRLLMSEVMRGSETPPSTSASTSQSTVYSTFGANTRKGRSFGTAKRMPSQESPSPGPARYEPSKVGVGSTVQGKNGGCKFPQNLRKTLECMYLVGGESPGPGAGVYGYRSSSTPRKARCGFGTSPRRTANWQWQPKAEKQPGPMTYSPRHHVLSTFK